MSPEERDRLVVAEADLRALKEDVAEIKASLRRLEALANMGKGALSLFLKLGAVVSVVAAALWAIADKVWKVHA